MAESKILAKRVLIWKNSSPAAEVATGVTITVDTTQYTSFEIECSFIPADYSQTVTTKCPSGHKTWVTILGVDTSTTGYAAINYVARPVDCGYDNANQIVIGAGYMIYQGTLYSGWASRAVPQCIYGIRE
jgi:hypothetical protein